VARGGPTRVAEACTVQLRDSPQLLPVRRRMTRTRRSPLLRSRRARAAARAARARASSPSSRRKKNWRAGPRRPRPLPYRRSDGVLHPRMRILIAIG
jgi:hypothetical protein